MFDVGSSELLLIIVVAIVVIGPKDLPRALYKLGQVIGKAKGMARHFRTGFDAMIREAELDELQKQWAKENERIMAASQLLDMTDTPQSLTDESGAQLPSPDHSAPDQPALDYPYEHPAGERDFAGEGADQPRLPLDQPEAPVTAETTVKGSST